MEAIFCVRLYWQHCQLCTTKVIFLPQIVRDSNQAAQYNSDKCPWSILTCTASETGMTVSILAELTEYGATNDQKLIKSSHGANLFVDTSGKGVSYSYEPS